MDIREIETIIEAMLFAAGGPVSLEKISDILELDKKTCRSIADNMIVKFQESGRGITIREIGKGYQMCSKAECFDYVRKLFSIRQKQGLSQAAFETLAIIAYNQPVTRAKIEALRGVNSDSALSKLIDCSLVIEGGRMEAPGRPVLYKTTENFLRSFGYKTLSDLPSIEMFAARIDNGDKVG